MTRQDDFLRTVRHFASEAQNSVAPGFGLAMIIQAIDDRLPELKAVAYENHDLSSGLSWDGHIICGDRKSIDAVNRALHDQSNIDSFWRPGYLRMQAQLTNGKIVYHLEIQSRDNPDRYVRQDISHEVLEHAKDSAYEITNFWARGWKVRVVKVTTHTHEEVIE